MRAGVGSIDITPDPGAYLAGFGNRNATFINIHDPLTVRALVVEDTMGDRSALIVLDLLALDFDQVREIQAEVAAATGITAASTLVATTHTHSGPACLPDRLGVDASPSSLAELVTKTVSAVNVALRALRPAELIGVIGHEASVGKNRRVIDGPIDPELPVVVIRDPESLEVFGVFCSYACHPVVLGPRNLSISADYPAVIRTTIEAKYPGALAIFATGCAGQINTGHRAGDAPGAAAERRTFAEAERLGRLLATAALSAVTKPLSQRSVSGEQDTISFIREEVALPRLDRASALEIESLRSAWLCEQGETDPSDSGQLNLLRIQLEWASTQAQVDPACAVPDLLASVTTLRWGNLVIVGLPGEPFVEFGLSIKAAIAEFRGVIAGSDHPSITGVVLGYANGCVGYVPHRSAYAEGGYEVDDAHRFYNEPSAFAPEAGERLVDAAIRSIERAFGAV